MVSWGIIVVIMAFVQTSLQLGILRFCLGVAEAGFFPGIILYLSFWCTKEGIAKSYAVFIAAMPVVLVIGSPVTTWIIQFADWFGIAGWRWVFIIQGLLAVIAGIYTFILLPSVPAAARWLNSAEKEWLKKTLDTEEVRNETPLRILFRQLVRDRRVLVLTLCLFLVYLALFGIVFWLPQIVRSFEKTMPVFYIGILLMVPYAAATIVMFLWGRHSDRTRERVYHVVLPVVVAAVALGADALVADSALSMIFLGIALIALFSAIPPFWAIVIATILPGLRPAGTAFINSFASLGSFAGPVIFGIFVQQSNQYDEVPGLAALGGALVLCCCLLLFSGKELKARSIDIPP
jgi:Sugar phosphate permease